MDYQKEKEMQQELREELAPQIAAALSNLLAQTWAHKPPPDRDWYTYITGPRGCGIHASVDSHNGGRLAIIGLWPDPIRDTRGTHTFYPYKDRPRITVAFGRGAQAIAKDITRRFLPKYLPMWEQAVQRRDAYKNESKREQEFLDRLAAAGGAKATHEAGQPEVRIWQRGRFDEPQATATVSFYPDADNPTVELKLENIPVTSAETILALVGQL